MDIPVVLSHRTAWLFHHSRHRHEVVTSGKDYGIDEFGTRGIEVGNRIRRFLVDCGVPPEELEELHTTVALPFMRPGAKGFHPHALGNVLRAQHVIELVPGLLVASEPLCFAQAGSWMTLLELIEYGFELFGNYELDCDPEGSYIETPASVSKDEVKDLLSEYPSMLGCKAVRSALTRSRENSRSPMESALAMMICLPRSQGGLGFRGIEMNGEVSVPPELRAITTSNRLEVDVLARKKRAGFEYDGKDHATAEQRARDAERLSVLNAMGIKTRVVTKREFSQQLPLHRALNAIARLLGVPIDEDVTFQRRQNELRKFLIRSWTS